MQIALVSVRLKVSQVFVKTTPLKHILLLSYVSEVLAPATVAVTILCVLSNNTKTPLPAEMTKKSLVELDSNVWSISTHLSRAIAPFFSLCGDNESLSSFCLGNTGLYI